MTSQKIAVIGAGIVGAAVAREVVRRRPGADVTVFDKEPAPAHHQTGHNSGVVHAGLYYKPGSLKATLCQRGRRLLEDYCAEKSIVYDEVGKVLVARDEDAKARLLGVHKRALENKVTNVRALDQPALAELEPSAVGIAGLYSPHTAITDFSQITAAFLDDVRSANGRVRLGMCVEHCERLGEQVRITTQKDSETFDHVVACGGLQSDRLVRRAGLRPEVSIIPFRGSYYNHREPTGVQLNGLVYPVPDPKYPFLGVHVTRHVDGAISMGPNAVLALNRERYNGFSVRPGDVADMALWPGFYPMALQHWTTGVREMVLSTFKSRFFSEVRKIFRGIDSPSDLVPSEYGIRAQAVDRRGNLLDDFSVQSAGALTFVMNAPSPAATASMAIAEHIVAHYMDM